MTSGAIGLVAYGIICLSLLVASWKYPAVALAGVLCMFGLEQWGQATTRFFAQHQTVTNLIIGGILVSALMMQSIRRGFALVADYPVVGWLTLALFVYAFASTQWAPRPDLSANLWSSRWPYIITVVLLSPLLITEPRDLRAANAALVLAGGLLAVLLLLFVKWESRRIVLENDFGNPLAIAAMAGMVVLIIILADPWPESKMWFPMKWTLVALSLALIVRSGSRGQLLGVLLSCVICWPISRGLRNVKQFAVLSLVIIFLGVAVNWTMQEFWGEEISGGRGRWSGRSAEKDISERLANAVMMVRLAAASPETLLFGLGNSAAYDPRILGYYPHFLPLEILAEEGIIGFGLYGMILSCGAFAGYRSWRLLTASGGDQRLLGGLSSLFLFAVILSLKQGNLLGNLDPFMLAIILGRYEKILAGQLVAVGHKEETRTQAMVESSGSLFGRLS